MARASCMSSFSNEVLNQELYSASGMAALLRESMIGEGVGIPDWGLRLT